MKNTKHYAAFQSRDLNAVHSMYNKYPPFEVLTKASAFYLRSATVKSLLPTLNLLFFKKKIAIFKRKLKHV